MTQEFAARWMQPSQSTRQGIPMSGFWRADLRIWPFYVEYWHCQIPRKATISNLTLRQQGRHPVNAGFADQD
jgi:hypothetical protein